MASVFYLCQFCGDPLHKKQFSFIHLLQYKKLIVDIYLGNILGKKTTLHTMKRLHNQLVIS